MSCRSQFGFSDNGDLHLTRFCAVWPEENPSLCQREGQGREFGYGLHGLPGKSRLLGVRDGSGFSDDGDLHFARFYVFDSE